MLLSHGVGLAQINSIFARYISMSYAVNGSAQRPFSLFFSSALSFSFLSFRFHCGTFPCWVLVKLQLTRQPFCRFEKKNVMHVFVKRDFACEWWSSERKRKRDCPIPLCAFVLFQFIPECLTFRLKHSGIQFRMTKVFFFVCRASCKTYFSMRIFFSSRGSIRFSASCNSASKNKVSFLCKFCLSAEHFHNPSFSRKPPRSFGLFSLCSIVPFRPRLINT